MSGKHSRSVAITCMCRQCSWILRGFIVQSFSMLLPCVVVRRTSASDLCLGSLFKRECHSATPRRRLSRTSVGGIFSRLFFPTRPATHRALCMVVPMLRLALFREQCRLSRYSRGARRCMRGSSRGSPRRMHPDTVQRAEPKACLAALTPEYTPQARPIPHPSTKSQQEEHAPRQVRIFRSRRRSSRPSSTAQLGREGRGEWCRRQRGHLGAEGCDGPSREGVRA